MHIHFIIHEAYEGPAAFLDWAEQNQFPWSMTRVYLNEALPKNLNFDLLIVLGGPQCPATSREECAYFDAQAEIAFILESIKKKRAVVGVCLGAQLIGEALGAHYHHSPEPEIGYFPISLTEQGMVHPLFSHFNGVETVGHWHNDMPGLPSGARVLASSQGCPRQIVEFTDRVFGFQCHLEFTVESISELIDNSHDLMRLSGKPWVQTQQQLESTTTDAMNLLLFGFLDKLAKRYRDRQ